MSKLEIIGEGESLEEARKQVESQVERITGPFLRSDRIVSDGTQARAKIIATVVTPGEDLPEFMRLVEELIQIGVTQGYLARKPEGNIPYPPGFHQEGRGEGRNIRAGEIGEKLYEMGGQDLMRLAWHLVRESAADQSHLRYCWSGIGGWLA